ncbi:TPA: phage tail protein [Vibrio parahaemolyticus]
MGANPADINKESFEIAARTLFLEGLGMSLMVDSVSSAQDIITEIEKTIDGVFRLNTETGLLELKLCRADYVVDDLLVIDESIITDVSRYERAGISNGVNVVRVTYTSADDNFESKSVAAENIGSCHATQNTEFANIAYKGITNADNANKLAMRYLMANSADMTSLEITCNEKSLWLE